MPVEVIKQYIKHFYIFKYRKMSRKKNIYIIFKERTLYILVEFH